MKDELKEPIETINSKQETARIFSQEEIEIIVKEFITSYLRGDIKIEFIEAKEIMATATRTGRQINLTNARKEEIAGKEPFLKLVSICTGSKPSSPEERKKAVCNLFDLIVILRSGGRLEGSLMTINVEKRLAKIERDLAETNKLVLELIIFSRSVVEGKGKSGDRSS